MTTIPRNLETLSFAQLTKLEGEVSAAKNRKYEAACSAAETQLRAKLNKIVADLGISQADAPVISPANGKHRVRSKSKVAIKYRQGENTWTGRGRAPRWLVAAEKAGQKRTQFLVA